MCDTQVNDSAIADEQTNNSEFTVEELATPWNDAINGPSAKASIAPSCLTDDIGRNQASHEGQEERDDEDALVNAQNSNATRPLKRKILSNLKKAPDAPKRFKSAYIFFSAEKHKEIRAQLGDKGVSEQTSNISKLVSIAWKELLPEQKQKWEAMALTDKARFDMEKTLYDGPWQIPRRRTPKDSSAPKRPMSSFLAFANSRRATVKERLPKARNGDISKELAAMWREASDEVRQPFVNWERSKRQAYKIAMAEWKRKDDERKHLVRHRREEKARRLAENVRGNKSSGGDDSSLDESKDATGSGDCHADETEHGPTRASPFLSYERDGDDTYADHRGARQEDSSLCQAGPYESSVNQVKAKVASSYASYEVHCSAAFKEDHRIFEGQAESVAGFSYPGVLDASDGSVPGAPHRRIRNKMSQVGMLVRMTISPLRTKFWHIVLLIREMKPVRTRL